MNVMDRHKKQWKFSVGILWVKLFINSVPCNMMHGLEPVLHASLWNWCMAFNSFVGGAELFWQETSFITWDQRWETVYCLLLLKREANLLQELLILLEEIHCTGACGDVSQKPIIQVCILKLVTTRFIFTFPVKKCLKDGWFKPKHKWDPKLSGMKWCLVK